ncbi:MAG: hypothetical protein LIO71_02895 [Ruminococcus sp.]|nr:hypothetical protein [Ruminococcus sp.]
MEQELSTTLYDMNKSLSLNETPLKKHEIKDKLRQFMFPLIQESGNNYFMLLCRERYDFTLFNYINTDEADLAQGLKDMYECLFNRGDVTTIEFTENKDALEIWMIIDGEAYVFYFFPYDLGVIEVNES